MLNLEDRVIELENKNKVLERKISEYSKYVPYIYIQKETTNEKEFLIEIPINRQTSKSIIYFIPTFGSKSVVETDDTDKNVLNLKQSSTVVSYTLKEETNNGALRKASLGTIVPNRLCMIRLQGNDAIVVNSSTSQDILLSSLTVTNDVTFFEKPIVKENVLDKFGTPLITKNEFDELLSRVTALENKIVTGTLEPSDALSNKPEGTIYLRLEE